MSEKNEEIKKYRLTLFLYLLISAAGAALGVLLFGKLGSGESYLPNLSGYFDRALTDFNGFYSLAVSYLEIFYSDLKFFLLAILLSFTVFFPFASSVLLLYRGFCFGSSVACLFSLVNSSRLVLQKPLLSASVFVFFSLCSLFAFVCLSARSLIFCVNSGYSRRSCAPEIRMLTDGGNLKLYFLSVVIIVGFLFLATVFRYFLLLLL